MQYLWGFRLGSLNSVIALAILAEPTPLLAALHAVMPDWFLHLGIAFGLVSANLADRFLVDSGE